jgi:hypothetical protein
MPILSNDKKEQLSTEAAKSSNKGNKMLAKGQGKLESAGGIFGGIGGFIKGLNTPIEAATGKLAELIADALKAGEDYITKGAGNQSKAKARTEAFGAQDPYKVIASSMAKVGGGGGYMVQGMTIEARTNMRKLAQQVLTNELIVKQTVAIEKLGADKMKP